MHTLQTEIDGNTQPNHLITPNNGQVSSVLPMVIIKELTREEWLLQATQALTPLFTELGHIVPAVKVSVGFASSGSRSHAIGQCWPQQAADDQLNHIFISPGLGTAYEVIDTLAHELIHAVDNCKNKHGKVFKAIALGLGMVGPMRNAGAGPVLKLKLEAILSQLPPYPHKRLYSPKRERPEPSPRAKCEQCGYRLTIPKRYVEYGPPICPIDKVAMKAIGNWGDSDIL